MKDTAFFVMLLFGAMCFGGAIAAVIQNGSLVAVIKNAGWLNTALFLCVLNGLLLLSGLLFTAAYWITTKLFL